MPAVNMDLPALVEDEEPEGSASGDQMPSEQPQAQGDGDEELAAAEDSSPKRQTSSAAAGGPPGKKVRAEPQPPPTPSVPVLHPVPPDGGARQRSRSPKRGSEEARAGVTRDCPWESPDDAGVRTDHTPSDLTLAVQPSVDSVGRVSHVCSETY